MNYTMDDTHTVYRDGERLAKYKTKADAKHAIERYQINDKALENISIYVNGKRL